MKFSSFIISLQKDPWFTIETYNRRTDSTFFFLSGTYKNFNPFRYAPKEFRMIVAEEEIFHNDSLHTPDTIMNLQILGVADTDIASKKAVEKEFSRFNNNKTEGFLNSTYDSRNDTKGQLTSEILNYFVFPFSIAPVTIAWGFLPGTKKYTFTITIRFKVRENAATYIIAPDEL